MKKFWIVTSIIVAIVILALAVYIFIMPFFERGFIVDNIESDQIKFNVSSTETNEEIAMDLMSQYLGFYKWHGLYSRLLNYNIESITATQADNQTFSFISRYSVKPLYGKHTMWYIGDGTDGSNGWINEEYRFIFQVENGIYKLTDITGTI